VPHSFDISRCSAFELKRGNKLLDNDALSHPEAVWPSAALSVLPDDRRVSAKRYKQCHCVADKNITNFFVQT
jgi:hypothetical protein